MIAKDFKVGDGVSVIADQGIRHGYVTKIGRTRITVRHPRNARGIMVERAYPMMAIVVSQASVAKDRGYHRGKPYVRFETADGGNFVYASNYPKPYIPITEKESA